MSDNTIAVGANLEDGAAREVNGTPNEDADDAGAAYVFERTGGVWAQTAYLKASNADADDWFGYSVEISGDTIAVGAWQEDSNEKGTAGIGSSNAASSAGAAYVFVRDGMSWIQQAYLKASNAAASTTSGTLLRSPATRSLSARGSSTVGRHRHRPIRLPVEVRQGCDNPERSTSFKFRNGDFEFDSTSYAWLVVAGARAQYKGKGVIHNVTGTYDFLLTTIDGDVAGGGGFDRFRLKITGPDGTPYDNQMDAPDSADPTNIIASGLLVIRK